jgi:2-polyprenyl-3-methyl-5-hydroxy-6-metoxy-1,4-benzoquinol methylase
MGDEAKAIDRDKAKRFLGQITNDLGAAMLGALTYIGDRLGIFKALPPGQWLTSEELARRTGFSERCLREWLGAMAAAGYVEYEPANRAYMMPPEHALVLANEDSPLFMGGFIQMVVPNVTMAPRVADAFRTGTGVPQSDYPPETFHAMERSSAGMYRHRLVRKWLPAMPQVVEALNAGATVADVGCGSGRAAIALASAFPHTRVYGYDVHPVSIERARVSAEEAGVADRVTFEVRDGIRLPEARFDFVSTFDVVHDAADPVALLRAIRRSLKPEGTYLMVEMNVSPNVEENLNAKGRMMYSISTLYCMTVSLAEGGAGIGAMMGEPKAREFATEAGFRNFRRLPIDELFSALYEIRP